MAQDANKKMTMNRIQWVAHINISIYDKYTINHAITILKILIFQNNLIIGYANNYDIPYQCLVQPLSIEKTMALPKDLNPNMIANNLTPFQPTHPGEVLKDELEHRGISQRGLARQVGISYSVLMRLLFWLCRTSIIC